MIATWQEFWNKKHRIYVSPRHMDVYYKVLSRGTLEMLPAHRPLVLLDWGCGDALASPTLRNQDIEVLLYDPTPYVQERISARFSNEQNIRVLTAKDFTSQAMESVDIILIFSVLQYISADKFQEILPQLQAILVPNGVLLLGDIVPKGLSMFADVIDLLKAGFRHGFFFDAITGIVATLFSDYRSVRNTNGFTTYSEEEIIDILHGNGFVAERMPKNIGLSGHRMFIKAIKKC